MRNPLVPTITLASVVIGFGLSTIDWGELEGVHGTGWPIPTAIKGLPDDAATFIKDFADLGFLATALNIGLALLAGFFLYAVIRLIIRITSG